MRATKQDLAVWLAACSCFVVIATFFVYFGQLRAMHDQLSEFGKARDGDRLVAVLSHLQEPDLREARGRLYNCKTDYDDWSKAQRKDAQDVCASLDVAGAIVRGMTPSGRDTFMRSWAGNIRKLHTAARRHVDHMEWKTCDRDYWGNLRWLVTAAEDWKPKTNSNRGSPL